MGFTSDLEIERIGQAVADRSLPKSQWTHAAHFAAAFWLVRQPGRVASREMPGLIRAYNEATGVANTDSSGYHQTITLASLRAAQKWLKDRPSTPMFRKRPDLTALLLGVSRRMMSAR